MAKRKFGVELEYEIPRSSLGKVIQKVAKGTRHAFSWSNNPRYWSAVEEHHGSEFTTPILQNIKDLDRAIKILKKELPKISKFKGAKRCQNEICGEGFGLHVHVDVRDLISKHKNRSFFFLDLYHLLLNIEGYLLRLHPKFRHSEIWVTPLDYPRNEIFASLLGTISGLYYDNVNTDKLGWWNKLEGEARDDLLSDYIGTLGDYMEKESCISFATIVEHGSLEFRFGTSSLRPEYVSRWTEVCRLVVDRAADSIEKKRIPKPRSFEAFLRWLKPGKRLETWMRKQHRTMMKVTSPCRLPV